MRLREEARSERAGLECISAKFPPAFAESGRKDDGPRRKRDAGLAFLPLRFGKSRCQ
jgi:hypothetical protein